MLIASIVVALVVLALIVGVLVVSSKSDTEGEQYDEAEAARKRSEVDHEAHRSCERKALIETTEAVASKPLVVKPVRPSGSRRLPSAPVSHSTYHDSSTPLVMGGTTGYSLGNDSDFDGVPNYVDTTPYGGQDQSVTESDHSSYDAPTPDPSPSYEAPSYSDPTPSYDPPSYSDSSSSYDSGSSSSDSSSSGW